MAWIVLILSGMLEAGWALSLKASDGFSKLGPSIAFVVFAVGSLGGLSWALKSLPVGVAYGVWVGIGAAGAAVVGMAVLGEPATAARIFFVCLLLVSVVGLKATSGH